MARDLADQFREELHDFYKDRLDLEHRISTLEHFMLRYDKPSMPSDSKIRVASTEGKYRVVVAIILAIQGIAIAVIAFLK